jgi:hypothetical protein
MAGGGANQRDEGSSRLTTLLVARRKIKPDRVARKRGQLAALAPERAEELQAQSQRREEQARGALVKRLSVAAIKREIAPDIAVIIAAEKLIEEAHARINAAVDLQRSEAARAQTLGLDVEPMHEGHKRAHLEHARYLSLPAEGRQSGKLWEKFTSAFCVQNDTWGPGYEPENGHHYTFDELLGFILDSPSPQASKWRAIIHARALEAGDPAALRWEAGRNPGQAKKPVPADEDDEDDTRRVCGEIRELERIR